jgi:hypothetical protein
LFAGFDQKKFAAEGRKLHKKFHGSKQLYLPNMLDARRHSVPNNNKNKNNKYKNNKPFSLTCSVS